MKEFPKNRGKYSRDLERFDYVNPDKIHETAAGGTLRETPERTFREFAKLLLEKLKLELLRKFPNVQLKKFPTGILEVGISECISARARDVIPKEPSVEISNIFLELESSTVFLFINNDIQRQISMQCRIILCSFSRNSSKKKIFKNDSEIESWTICLNNSWWTFKTSG